MHQKVAKCRKLVANGKLVKNKGGGKWKQQHEVVANWRQTKEVAKR